ncbi:MULTISPECIES: STAS domain-containing protein [Saccharothrix]|uniref:Anti-sigma factor antagonist n=2 Tax=Saccharothrix TaxID=2071 RepID=A0ABU0X6L0_9PSEU|nr:MULTISPECIES: STAS domain-containing protein [Saccharothrix]MDQ2587758.1 anti-anti-sigma factor [Saccharothrix yanglingensis]MDR6595600.1 anti-anti-sigma factor [Saccharothrix longispora]
MTVQDPNVVATAGAESAASSNPRAGQVGLTVRQAGAGATVVGVSGEIDMLTAPQLRAEVLRHLAAGTTLVLDLSGVSFLGSAGLAVLVEAAQHGKRRDAAFRVVAVARAVTRPLAATGLGEVFSVFESVEQALGADEAR